MELSPQIFRAYDVRGIIGKTLDDSIAYKLGLAIGSLSVAAGNDCVIVGYDGRLSSHGLSKSLSSGLANTGCSVINIGEVPTPLVYFANQYLQVKTAIMITGSHNPPDYNGFKIILNDKPLHGDDIQNLYDVIVNHNYHTTTAADIADKDISEFYLDKIVSSVTVTRPFKLVVDCGNGVAGKLAPQLYKQLNCEVIPLYCEVDGTFPNHHPDPGDPNNLNDLINKVQETGADLGFAFDGDGDRLGIIDNNGKIIWPDRLLMLLAKDVLTQNKGATIIFDVKCSHDLFAIVKQNQGIPCMWKTGHSLIKAKIKETGALLAGEMSGHVFFNDKWYGFDDGLYTGARLLEVISNQAEDVASIFSKFPENVSTSELFVIVSDEEKFALMDSILSQAKFNDEHKIATIDGLRVDFPFGWGLVRPSNTTPKLIFRFEADKQENLQKIQQEFRKLLLSIKPDLQLPF